MTQETAPRMSSILSLFNVPGTLQESFPAFDSMFSLFLIVFIIAIVLTVLIFAFNLWRMIKSGKAQDQTYTQPTQPQPPVAEKEIIHEIVKIRCPYCGNLYDEDQNKCPTCGAKR
jgi:DNA-directed RNA polymerase subunit RPC12/RpoP